MNTRRPAGPSLLVLVVVLLGAMGRPGDAAAGAFTPWPAVPFTAPPPAALPLAFAANHGQAGDRAAYLARGAGYTLALGRAGARLDVGDASVGIDFVGGRARPALAPGAPLPGHVNDLHGDDPSRWLRHIPTFGHVDYQQVWRGVDARFYGREGKLEYDFNVAPGADPGAIRLSFPGAKDVRLGPDGALRIGVPGGTLRQLVPRAVQDGRRVAAIYRLRDGVVGVRLGAYDHSRPLVVDPVLSYSTYLGGTGSDSGYPVAVDAAGSAYLAGYSTTGFPTSSGAAKGGGDTFVAKLNSTGTALVYSTFFGGSAIDAPDGLAVDATGHAYVGGTTKSRDFPVTDDAFQVANHDFGEAYGDIFVAKLAADGASFVYATYLGGDMQDSGGALALGDDGSAYVTGASQSPDYPTTPGVMDRRNASGNSAVVLTKLDPSGSSVAWSTYTTSGSDDGADVAVDATGHAYLTGLSQYGVPTTSGAYRSDPTTLEAFAEKVKPDGSGLDYGTYLGPGRGSSIAIDGSGRAYVTGGSGAVFQATPGTYQPNPPYGSRLFALRLSADGATLDYATALGAIDDYNVRASVVVDAAGDAFVAGPTRSLPTTPGAVQPASGGGVDGFVAELPPNGSTLSYSTYLGGASGDFVNGLALGAGGALYVAGTTGSSDFPTTAGALQPALNPGSGDAFVAKLVPEGPALRTSATAVACTPNPVALSSDSSCTITVTDTSPGTPVVPSGQVGLGTVGSASADQSCTLAATGSPGTAACAVNHQLYAEGPAQLTGRFPGSAALRPSVSPATTLTGTPGSRPTTTAISCPAAAAGSRVTCTVTVTDAGSAPPAVFGTVVVQSDDGQDPNVCLLSGSSAGVAKCTVSYLAPVQTATSTHTLTATYRADANHSGSTVTYGETVTGVVKHAVPSSTLTCTPTSVTLGFTGFCVLRLDDNGATDPQRPTGTITWASTGSAAFSTTCPLTVGSTDYAASCGILYRPTAENGGSHTITATFGGDTFHPGDAKSATIAVTPASPHPTNSGISCEPATRAVGAKVGCRVTVLDSASSGRATPAGTMTVSSDGQGTFVGGDTCTLVSTNLGVGICYVTYRPTARGSGTHRLTVTYSGELSHSSSTKTFDEAVTGGDDAPVAAAPSPGPGPSASASPTATATRTPAPTVVPSPVLARLKVASFRRRKGGKVTFTLSRAAAVTVTFGRRKGKRYKKVAFKLRATAKAGTTALKIKKRKLKKGRYRATATPAGGKAVSVTFRVK